MLISTHAAAHAFATRLSPRIGLKVSHKILFIDPREIIAVHAEGNYVSLRRESGAYFVRESISHLEEKLQGYGFIRIHRSALVNAGFVEEVRPHSTGEYFVRVKGGKEYTVTRTYKKNLASLAALWIGAPGFGEQPYTDLK
jgi:two-component system LytT family response regulator